MKDKEKKESFGDRLLKYINNRTLRKPRRNKSINLKYKNNGAPVGDVQHITGIGKNYAVMYFPKRKKLKGWQKVA
jgi:hypothetical protein